MRDFCSFAPELILKEEIALTPFESHHLVTTNRARAGDTVVLFDGTGNVCDAILKVADSRKAILTHKDYQEAENHPGDRFD